MLASSIEGADVIRLMFVWNGSYTSKHFLNKERVLCINGSSFFCINEQIQNYSCFDFDFDAKNEY